MTLCLTGSETSLAALEKRLADHSDPSFVHEIRIDFLKESMNDVCQFIRQHQSQRLVAALRTQEQGGQCDLGRGDVRSHYETLAGSGATWLDVESWLTDAEILHLANLGGHLLLSHHDFSGMGINFESQVATLAARPVAGLKVAVAVADAAELARLETLHAQMSMPHQLIGMGFPGQLSRARFEHFGNLWTYVAVGGATAPGQPDLTLARAWGLPASARAPFLAVVGGPQIAHSPGSRVYNALFRTRGLPWSYLQAQTAHAAETFALLRRLGALGCSVTMPHKEAAFAAATQRDALSNRARAANSLRFDGSETFCTLTDVDGVLEPLRKAGANASDTMLVLGAGGAARASWLAACALGIPCRIAARDPHKARACFEPDTPIVAWDARVEEQATILVNATPLTDATLWPNERPLPSRIVFDTALGAGQSLLVARAAQQGLRVISPIDMWIAQGQAQLKWLTGLEVDLRRHVTD